MADLLTEACSPAPKFAAVICEDIERSGRDMFNALKLEKELSRQGIPLFATDEPADIEGVNATTVLVRRVKQGVAEWYRLQLKEKIWKGLIEHSLDGWNIGTPPYGYPPSGPRTRSRTRPPRAAPKPASSSTRPAPPSSPRSSPGATVDKLGLPGHRRPAQRRPGRLPAPEPGHRVDPAEPSPRMLANPKYTGYMVYGRHRTRNGRRIPVPPDQWLWSPAPVHPAIVDRATWDAAQDVGAGHGTSRDGDDLNTHPATARFYPYGPGSGAGTASGAWPAPPTATHGAPSTYYRCPHDPATPKHAADLPGPPPHRPGPRTPAGPDRGPVLRHPDLRPRPRRPAGRPAPRHRRRRRRRA